MVEVNFAFIYCYLLIFWFCKSSRIVLQKLMILRVFFCECSVHIHCMTKLFCYSLLFRSHKFYAHMNFSLIIFTAIKRESVLPFSLFVHVRTCMNVHVSHKVYIARKKFKTIKHKCHRENMHYFFLIYTCSSTKSFIMIF